MLVTKEIFPTPRLLEDDVGSTEMTGVEHLGQYVFEMARAKVEALKRGEIVFGANEKGDEIDVDEDAEMSEGEGLRDKTADIIEDDSEEEEDEEGNIVP